MIDYVNNHLWQHKAGKDKYEALVVPHIVCRDGTSPSVQASSGHYCSPRKDTGPWDSVEVWRIASPEGRKIHARSFGPRSDDPYGWVPVTTVNRFIRRHGGIKED